MTPTVLSIATEVAYRGHVSTAVLVARFGVTVEAVQAAADAGLIRPVPRIGGWVPTQATNGRVFGRAYAEAVAR